MDDPLEEWYLGGKEEDYILSEDINVLEEDYDNQI